MKIKHLNGTKNSPVCGKTNVVSVNFVRDATCIKCLHGAATKFPRNQEIKKRLGTVLIQRKHPLAMRAFEMMFEGLDLTPQ